MDLKEDSKELGKEIATIILAAVILGGSIAYTTDTGFMLSAIVSFLVILGLNFFIKKIAAYHYEADIETKFWGWYQYGLHGYSHFSKPLPMFWLPIAIAIVTRGWFWWLTILEFDIKPRVERAARRHGTYRFTEMTDWHIAWIAAYAVFANLLFAVIGYLAGFELFAKLSVYFAVWSVLPISSWDGAKILYGGRMLWFVTVIVTAIAFFFALTIT